jgi:hypothetical protein
MEYNEKFMSSKDTGSAMSHPGTGFSDLAARQAQANGDLNPQVGLQKSIRIRCGGQLRAWRDWSG